MPTYSYRCTECGTAFDIQQAFTDDSLSECPTCGGKLRKLFSAVGVSFSGSGFYRNDSRAAENKKAAKKDAAPSESKPGESKPGESKPGESKPGESKPAAASAPASPSAPASTPATTTTPAK